MTWTIGNVPCTDTAHCSTTQQDVDLGLFITRSAPDSAKLQSGDYWDLATTILKDVAINVVGLIIEPENPMTWIHLALSSAEIACDATDCKTEFDNGQSTDDGTPKWYVTAYPFPAPGSNCFKTPYTTACYPGGELSSDGVKTEWGGYMGGYAQSNIVVTVELRRPVAPVPEYLCLGNGPGFVGSLGAVPVAVVTVMTAAESGTGSVQTVAGAIATGAPGPTGKTMPATAEVTNAAKLIRSTLQESGRQGILTLFSIIRGLNDEQRQVLRDMYTAWRAGNAFTPRQQAFLYMLAVQLRGQVRKEG